MKIIYISFTVTLFAFSNVFSQNNNSVKNSEYQEKEVRLFRDSLDNKLDLSSWLMQATGFVPLIQIVTEQSLGSFGLVASPVFIKPNKYQIKGEYIPPNITVGAAAYTANNSWFFGAMRIASLPKYGIKYRLGAAYANVNMNFYRKIPFLGEKEFEFNFRSVPFFGNILKQIGKTHFYAGIEYVFANTNLKPVFKYTELPDFVKEIDFNSTVSSLGAILQYDMRDNIFTPNNGLYLEADFRINDNWTGSDYTFQNMHLIAFKYFQLTTNWVSAYRFDADLLFGEAPFYLHPGINLRGVPLARYQGKSTYLFETEQRYDFTFRWSGVVFGGMAKAIEEDVSFNQANLVYNYGLGFRYLISRIFKIRMGVDVAWSNNDFGYYITFGSAWKR